MPINTNGKLLIFCVNVGQGDTTIIFTPGNHSIIIDAVRGEKIIKLLEDLGITTADPIHHMIITHPHIDHYSGVPPLLNYYQSIQSLSLTSLRRMANSTPGYNNIINTAVSKGIAIDFISGYSQFYPDNSPVADPATLMVELLGPSNQYIEDMFLSGALDTNHYSIITRLVWKDFEMIIAGDAQMETWAHFDSEQMFTGPCTVLRAAHHGSANGTQFERIRRLNPKLTIISSDPEGKDSIPDLIGAATFMRYSRQDDKPLVALTDNTDANKTGTIKIEVEPTGKRTVYYYGDHKEKNVNLVNAQVLTYDSNPTNWSALVQSKMQP